MSASAYRSPQTAAVPAPSSLCLEHKSENKYGKSIVTQDRAIGLIGKQAMWPEVFLWTDIGFRGGAALRRVQTKVF